MSATYTDALLVDIGQDTGALVVYAPAELEGRELEIVPARDPRRHPVHNVVRARRAGGRVVHAAVFPELVAGEYLPFGGWGASGRRLRVAGGHVTETEWRAPRPGGGSSRGGRHEDGTLGGGQP
jgi:hypothetical protein